MTTKLVYGAVREHPHKVIHVIRVVDELLETEEIEDIAERMREPAFTKHGEPNAAVVVVQGDSQETLRLHGEPYAVTRVRTAMFNAAVSWSDFELD